MEQKFFYGDYYYPRGVRQSHPLSIMWTHTNLKVSPWDCPYKIVAPFSIGPGPAVFVIEGHFRNFDDLSESGKKRVELLLLLHSRVLFPRRQLREENKASARDLKPSSRSRSSLIINPCELFFSSSSSFSSFRSMKCSSFFWVICSFFSFFWVDFCNLIEYFAAISSLFRFSEYGSLVYVQI